MVYECKCCKAPIKENDVYYQVLLIKKDGTTEFVKTCDQICAEEMQNYNYTLHLGRAETVKGQVFQVIKNE